MDGDIKKVTEVAYVPSPSGQMIHDIDNKNPWSRRRCVDPEDLPIPYSPPKRRQNGKKPRQRSAVLHPTALSE